MFICLHRSSFNGLLALFVGSLRAMAGEPVPSQYDRVIKSEQASVGSEQSYEYIASGAAAVVLGIYGYYNTSPNPVIKLLYVATQTAGVLTIGQAIRTRNAPSLMLDVDEVIRRSSGGQNIQIEELKKRMVAFKSKTSIADARTLAYTSSILSGLYFYNGYRETSDDKTLRNIYFFLGFNFAVSSGVGFYRIYRLERDTSGVSVEFFPMPTITYEF